MAIKVNGTIVIDDSRNLVNIASGAGSSTTAGAVGTYTWGRPGNNTAYAMGDTASSVFAVSFATNTMNYWSQNANPPRFDYGSSTYVSSVLSGTWRAMAPSGGWSSYAAISLWVRIS